MSNSATPQTVAHQAPLSLGCPRQEHWNRIVIFFSRGSFWPRDWTHVSCIAGEFFTAEPLGKTLFYLKFNFFFFKISIKKKKFPASPIVNMKMHHQIPFQGRTCCSALGSIVSRPPASSLQFLQGLPPLQVCLQLKLIPFLQQSTFTDRVRQE